MFSMGIAPDGVGEQACTPSREPILCVKDTAIEGLEFNTRRVRKCCNVIAYLFKIPGLFGIKVVGGEVYLHVFVCLNHHGRGRLSIGSLHTTIQAISKLELLGELGNQEISPKESLRHVTHHQWEIGEMSIKKHEISVLIMALLAEVLISPVKVKS